jgi:hypothetical protein
MTAAYNPQAAADKARATYRNVTAQLGLLGLDTAIPGAVRSVAEKTVAQTCEVCDRSRDTLDASIATFERSFDAAGQGAAAFNRKIIDLAQRERKFQLRPSQELGGGQEPRRDRGIAGGLLAEAVQRIDSPSRGSPREGS